ncbi:Conserved hypothetical protein [gamma proteobacterium HdN1]|nr:Conserved hypothetical protein [gamma proteobacterium HdN1]
MSSFPREELEEMVTRWLQANRDAEKEGDWAKHLGAMYTEDAQYGWNIGPNQEFMANNRQEIIDLAIGYQMKGFEDWEYPYHDIIIDEKRGTVIGFWKQRAPAKRADGTVYEVAGIGGSWFEYGGNFQWRWQRDFFDLGNTKALFFEMAGDGALSPTVKKKIQTHAHNKLLPGHRYLRPEPDTLTKARNFMAMVKIAATGR